MGEAEARRHLTSPLTKPLTGPRCPVRRLGTVRVGATRSTPLPDGPAHPALCLMCSLSWARRVFPPVQVCCRLSQPPPALPGGGSARSPAERAAWQVGPKLTHEEDYGFYSGEITKKMRNLCGRDGGSGTCSACACVRADSLSAGSGERRVQGGSQDLSAKGLKTP